MHRKSVKVHLARKHWIKSNTGEGHVNIECSNGGHLHAVDSSKCQVMVVVQGVDFLLIGYDISLVGHPTLQVPPQLSDSSSSPPPPPWLVAYLIGWHNCWNVMVWTKVNKPKYGFWTWYNSMTFQINFEQTKIFTSNVCVTSFIRGHVYLRYFLFLFLSLEKNGHDILKITLTFFFQGNIQLMQMVIHSFDSIYFETRSNLMDLYSCKY